jgi:hypothetical protein
MNLIDATVTKVLSKPYSESIGDVHWLAVHVQYEDDGGTSTKKLTFNTRAEADAVKVGYEFQH